MGSLRHRIETALSKPLPENDQEIHADVFDPWCDVIRGIHGSYASESDAFMILAMEAVRNRTTLEFIERCGFAAEFALYVLSGQGLTEYGTSPRGGWPDPDISDLWDSLIEKWHGYYEAVWGEPVEKETKV